ncbi:beta-galactosidase [Mangrovactinospora gilvigrisea]|uniref:Beta-galactosidase n=1 Tax=Mangrovactinospora gilvigrisea TaxID=1428644 RepID=A0A1J7C471_9ACTN|nr:beta-galactosidase [Mangrovactinospora gilvigrisea]OIV36344.1 beta-galactosidase [Mangrovactinospora gilvigrisea]
MAASEFRITREGYLLDGEPFRILSGAMHYFRTLPEQWPDRLRMLRAMGLNTVETYVAWNYHEPRPGEFSEVGQLSRFLAAAADAGLKTIVRPGPYICAEWENGGLPHWLRAEREDAPLRCNDPAYLAAVDRWFDRLIPEIVDHQVTRGGSMLMVQVENEYGSYGDDAAYLEHLRAGLVARGIDVPLFTSDGATDTMLTGGTVPGVHATVNFGSRSEREFAKLAEHRPDEPAMCMEFWNGWFDHWGHGHVTRDPQDAAEELDAILAAGASVNIYMAHGGTNFGLWSGANMSGPGTESDYRPTVTSYDYDAPLDEAGRPTAKYWAFREVLAKYGDVDELVELDGFEAPKPLAAASVRLDRGVRLLDVLTEIGGPETETAHVPSFEELGLGQGLAVHTARIPGPRAEGHRLAVRDLRDRAWVLADGRVVGRLEREGAAEDGPQLEVPAAGLDVQLLVESLGRVNFGARTGERKGALGGVRHGYQYLSGWRSRPVELATAARLLPRERLAPAAEALAGEGPVFLAGGLRVDEGRDGFLEVTGGSHGVVWVNGFCLGRYWEIGPQRTLYLPAPLLHADEENEVLILELDPARAAGPLAVEIREEPVLG